MKKLFKITLLTCVTWYAQAQQTQKFVNKNYWVQEAEKQFNLGIFKQAETSILQYAQVKKFHSLDFQTQYGIYLQLLSQLQQMQPNAVQKLQSFIAQTSFTLFQQRGNFYIARYLLQAGNFEQAIPAYEKSGIDFLSNEEISIRNFELGYAYLATQQLDKAAPMFASVKGIPGEYFTPGNYYHGIYAYYQKNYDEALASFKQAEKDPQFEGVIPFYLTELNYLKGNKEKALQDAKKILSGTQAIYFQNELNQLVAQIYFEQENFEQAEIYLQKYIGSTTSPRKEDYYRLGLAQYEQGKFSDAIVQFNAMYKDKDLLSQQAWYYLAKSYLSLHQKDNAYNAFVNCVDNGVSDKLNEISMFNIAKLSYDHKDDELAEQQLTSFIKKYPQSVYQPEANELLAYLHIKTDRFDDAMINMNKMKNISSPLKKMYQRANYARGIQMLIDENAARAINYFDESNRYKIDPIIASLTTFWQAEAMYRMGKYEEALDFADYFILHATDQPLQDYIHKAQLLKSYVYLHQEDKENLQKVFALIADPNVSSPEKLLGSSKSNFIPESIPIVENDPFILVFTNPELQNNFVYTPVPLKPVAMHTGQAQKGFSNYLKLGIGNLSTYVLEVGYDASRLLYMPLYIDYRSKSTSTDRIKFQRYSQSHLGIQTAKTIGAYQTKIVGTFDRNKQYYYGYNHNQFDYSNTDIKQVFSNAMIHITGERKQAPSYGLQELPITDIGMYTDKFGAIETQLLSDAKIYAHAIQDSMQFVVDAAVNANIYHVKNKGNQWNSALIIKPSLIGTYQGIQYKIGLNPVVAQKTSLLPDIQMSYRSQQIKATVLAGLQSFLRLNTFKEITQHNPFIFNYFQAKQSRNTDLFAGIQGSYLKNISYTTKIGLGWYRQLPVFINDTATDNKQFTVNYLPSALSFIYEANVNYTFNTDFYVGADIRARPLLKTFENKKAWGYRATTIDIYGKLKATKEIAIRADIFIRSGSAVIEKDKVTKISYARTLPGAIDVNVGANYIVNPNWNVFLDINNLFNNSYRRWYGYENFGTNIQFGVSRMFNAKK